MKTDADYREQLREFGVKGEYIDAFAGPDLDRIGNLIGVFRSDPVASPKRISDEALDVVIDYTNHRGERASRRIRPVPNGIFWGKTEWHPQRQWLLDAFDYEKNAPRTFAVAQIHSWRSPDAKQTVDEMVIPQLKRSMERNARMSNRLNLILVKCAAEHDTSDLLQWIGEILKDEEPKWPAASTR
jgi:hypothetical protein